MSTPTPKPLMPSLLAYLALCGAADSDEADEACARHERTLIAGEIRSADDLFAKARYLQVCGRVDPSLIPLEALDTLVVGVARLCVPALTSAGQPLQAAA